MTDAGKNTPSARPARRRRRPLAVTDLLILAVALVVVLVGRMVIVSVRTASASHPGEAVAELTARGPVYLVHLGEPTRVDLAPFQEFYRQQLGLDVTVLSATSVDSLAFDTRRGQLIAEEVIASMRRSFPAVAEDKNATLIGVVEQDLYIAKYDWAYAFGLRADRRFAVVSSARLEPANDAEAANDLRTVRLRKMLTKNIGVLALGLPLNDNPTSVLYRNAASVEDVDNTMETWEGAGSDAAPVKGPDISYPCLVVAHLGNPDGDTSADARLERCAPGLRMERVFDELEVNLASGALVTRHSDFFAPDSMPLALTRAYHSRDTISRAFGIGGNHPYDVLPVGGRNPYTYVDLVMPDGAMIRYDRISRGFGFADAVYQHHARTALFGSRFRWNGNGWDLRFPDGGLFLFPENYSGTRNHHGAPIGMQDGAGHHTVLQRDGDRRLTHVMSPGGHSLRFDYDSESRVRQITDNDGTFAAYTYDASGRLATVDTAGHQARYAYDDEGMLSTIANELRTLVTITYRDRRVSDIALGSGQRFRLTPMGGDGSGGRFTDIEIVDNKGLRALVPLRQPIQPD